MAALVTSDALYALLDASDSAHQAMVAALDEIEGPLVLVAPVLSESMRLAERFLGRDVALRLLDAVLNGEMLWQSVEGRDLQLAHQLLRAEEGLSASAAMAMAVAKRLGVATLLCLAPAARRAAPQVGLAVLPPDEANVT